MFFVVTSQIFIDDKRRTKIAKILGDFGTRVQYSVFECNLTDSEYRRLQKRLVRNVGGEGQHSLLPSLQVMQREGGNCRRGNIDTG